MLDLIKKRIQNLSEGRANGFIRSVEDFVYYRSSNFYGHYVTLLPFIQSPKYNGVRIRTAHLPWEDVDRPLYESGLCSAIERCVRQGDDVVIIGGGRGVTAVKAAQKVGETGSVVVFEGSLKQVRKTRETVRLNDVKEIVEIHHCIVGPDKNVYGAEEDATPRQMSVGELPECDILELDCEGAEIEILEDLSQKPRGIFVESHGVYDAPSTEISVLLKEMSYEITSITVADKHKENFCKENDILVITALSG